MPNSTNATPPHPAEITDEGELDLAAKVRLKQSIQQEIYRRHIIGQITQTVATKTPTTTNDKSGEGTDESTDKNKDENKGHGIRESGALAAWLGLTQHGDAIEAMIAAQLVATHDLTMSAMGRAITRTHQPGHFGSYITDACKAANATLRQIETLARYRTWRSKSGAQQDGEPFEAERLTT